jgi:hypothetical protein
MSMMRRLNVQPMTETQRDLLWQLFKDGPTHDSNLLSKPARTWLIEKGFAEREDGWNYLTPFGITLCLELGMGALKDSDRV